jgi:hypothetical protein
VATMGFCRSFGPIDWGPSSLSRMESIPKTYPDSENYGNWYLRVFLFGANGRVSLLSFTSLVCHTFYVDSKATIFHFSTRCFAARFIFVNSGMLVGCWACIATLMFGGLELPWPGVGECISMG